MAQSFQINAWDSDGRFHSATDLAWVDGMLTDNAILDPRVQRLSSILPATVVDGSEREQYWVLPGFTDAHVHVAWTDFLETDRVAHPAAERDALIRGGLSATLAAGFTSVRDAGGWDPQRLNSLTDPGPAPRISPSISIITRESSDAVGGIEREVERVLDSGAQWVKLMGTAGVASPVGAPLGSHFNQAEYRSAVALAERSGARVMVHAWGGDAITWALDAGVHSIEHGIFLSPEQAHVAAARGTTFVPTLTIYRDVLRMIDDGELPAVFRPRVAEAVVAHRLAVQRAAEAGVAIAVGTDFGTVRQHGRNREELTALHQAGLSAEEVLHAATVIGARLIGGPVTGVLEPGSPADCSVWRRDPLTPQAWNDPHAIAAVVKAGAVTQPHEGNR